MEQTEQNVPAGKPPEEPDRLQVAAEIAAAYPDLAGQKPPAGPPAAEVAQPAPEPVASAQPAAEPAAETLVGPTRHCPQCGNLIPATSRFCRYCGQQLALPIPQPSAPGQYSRPGSYIDRRLRLGEQILFRTRLHWIMLVEVVFKLALGAAIFWFYSYIALQPATLAVPTAPPGLTMMEVYPDGILAFYFIAFLLGVSALVSLVRLMISELAITDQRVLGRYGNLWSKPVDIALADISTVTARRFSIPDQGAIILACIPRRFYPFQHIPHPKQFRQRLEALLPAVRPPLARIKWWRVLLLTLFLTLVIAAVVVAVLYFAVGRG